MPRPFILSVAERESLLSLPASQDDLIRHYSLSESDLSLIRQRRGASNRLGFAILLSYMRYPGVILGVGDEAYAPLLSYVAQQVNIDAEAWKRYGQREQTRREHLLELQEVFGFKPFTGGHYRSAVSELSEIALQTDKGIVLATRLVESLRARAVLLPTLPVIERICSEAISQANRRIYATLSENLSPAQHHSLDGLLKLRADKTITTMAWLQQSPAASTGRHILTHIDRLKALRAIGLPDQIESAVHRNRLLKIAREGAQMTSRNLAKFEPERRHATLAAMVIETTATITDELIDLHDRSLIAVFNRAKHKHENEFTRSGKAINEKVRLYWRIGSALMQAKQSGADPFAAIESVLPWEAFIASVTEAEKLGQAEEFDYLRYIGDSYLAMRRYTPELLDVLDLRAAPAAQDVLDAVNVLRAMNAGGQRVVPKDAPTGFVRKRWESLVVTDGGVDRRFYELCALSELKNALRSGDIWVRGSRQFKDFDEYLLPAKQFSQLKEGRSLSLPIEIDGDRYIHDRLELLEQRLTVVNSLAAANELPDAVITESGLKITPLTNSVPADAESFARQVYALLPRVKITELLMEVDSWTGFTRHFTHIKTGESAADRALLLTVILADAINLGLTKMTDSCPGTTYAKLSWLQAWHIREETYSAALADLINAQFVHPFAAHWGDGSTSSSDGQRFRSTARAHAMGNVNPKYGSEPGVQFYSHISDQYAPFHTKVINVGVRDATYVLDGLLYHESDLRIEEHYTDTSGFTDHVFAMMHLLGFRFAPRIRDLPDKRLFVPRRPSSYPALKVLIGGTINAKRIRTQWDETLRLVTSIKQGTVTASLMLRKLSSYPRQNGLALAMREIGQIERTLFTLDWLQDVELRRRVTAGLNKGEAKHALERAVFFNRLGEIRDRSFEHQRYRASGLNLVVAAIVLWNTVYLERAVQALNEDGQTIDGALLSHLSPLGWEHINLTGDYVWKPHKRAETGAFRPLRRVSNP
jgi:TnpA family transposase